MGVQREKLTDFWIACVNRLFMCQDEYENEPEDDSFCSFWIKPVTNEPGLSTLSLGFKGHQKSA